MQILCYAPKIKIENDCLRNLIQFSEITINLSKLKVKAIKFDHQVSVSYIKYLISILPKLVVTLAESFQLKDNHVYLAIIL